MLASFKRVGDRKLLINQHFGSQQESYPNVFPRERPLQASSPNVHSRARKLEGAKKGNAKFGEVFLLRTKMLIDK